MNKRTVKKNVQQFLDKFAELLSDAQTLHDDLEVEADLMEPYDGHDDLTEKQQEKVDWLDELANALDEFCNSDVYDMLSSLIEQTNVEDADITFIQE